MNTFFFPNENLVEFTLHCTGTSKALERVFPIGFDFWTSEKSRLNVDALTIAFTVKFDMRDISCSEISDVFENDILIKKIVCQLRRTTGVDFLSTVVFDYIVDKRGAVQWCNVHPRNLRIAGGQEFQGAQSLTDSKYVFEVEAQNLTLQGDSNILRYTAGAVDW
ncbi:hypothetical protein TNCV_1731971 [Trichonephila clavipes]|nr:hypothetical protein TNCV_1731971 [Trichonephila clavipes]